MEARMKAAIAENFARKKAARQAAFEEQPQQQPDAQQPEAQRALQEVPEQPERAQPVVTLLPIPPELLEDAQPAPQQPVVSPPYRPGVAAASQAVLQQAIAATAAAGRLPEPMQQPVAQ